MTKKYPECSFETCHKTATSHTGLVLCSSHYSQRYSGKPLTPLQTTPEYFWMKYWERVEKTDTCWHWTGTTSREYGIVCKRKKSYPAHVISYEHFKGEIPKGMQIDHMCANKACVNPDHLRLATPSQNQWYKPGGGVQRKRDKWVVNVQRNYVKYYGGVFATYEEAKAKAEQIKKDLSGDYYFHGIGILPKEAA